MNNMANKLVYIGFGYLHHMGGHAGYHHIKDYLSYDYYIDAQRFHNIAQEPVELTFMARVRARLFPYFCFGFKAFPWYIVKCIILAFLKGNLTFHFIYGENLLLFVPLLQIRGCKVVCTLHQPFEWFEKNDKWKKYLKQVDAVILVGNSEISEFEKLTGKKNVKFIPHGICSDFYSPNKDISKENIVLTVGNWLRDYKFADKVYQALLSTDDSLNICIVTQPSNRAFIKPNERIHFLSGISDKDLRDLYCRCSVLFLPLIRYTANNSLLEAGACGCNIVISSNFPDNSYIPGQFITTCQMDESETIHSIKQCIAKSYNSGLSCYVSEHYSWTVISEYTKQFLLTI